MPSGRSPPASRFRNPPPPHRCRPVRLRHEVVPDPGEPLLQPRCLNHRERHPIHPRRAPVRTGQRIGVGQNVFAMDLVVEQVEAVRRVRLRLAIQLLLKAPDAIGCCQAHHQSPILVSVRSAPEVRVLPSTGITRSQRYHDPVRLPKRAVAICDVEDATSARCGSPPITRITMPACRAHYPGGSRRCSCRLLPVSRGLPRISGGSASASSLSRPAQASLTLRPVGLLNRPKAAFVARLQPRRLPRQAACQLPDQTDYYLGGTFLHWSSAPSGRTEKCGLTAAVAGPGAHHAVASAVLVAITQRDVLRASERRRG